MQTFEWVDATSVEQAASLLAASEPGRLVVAKAGGMDLIDLVKEGIVAPSRVVNLRSIDALNELRFDPAEGLRLGALTTLARLASDAEIRQRYPALAEAAGHAATPQVRNAATIGGNLLQRPRCWYLRSEHFHRLDGNDNGNADRNGDRSGDGSVSGGGRGNAGARLDRPRDGENQYHAIFDNAASALVHASTPATALAAYGARVELAAPGGARRTVALSDFLLAPDARRDRDAAIERGEVLTRVIVPAPPAGTRAAYHKQTERESYDWPICDVAIVLRMDGRTVRAASIVMGWVAPTPRRATAAERLLAGKTVDDRLAREAARAAVAGATPLSKNAYKVPVLEVVIRRTILAAAEAAAVPGAPAVAGDPDVL